MVQSDQAPNSDAGIFGFEATTYDAEMLLVGVPWEATASYGRGTSQTPQAIVQPSHQLDLFDVFNSLPFQKGIHLMDANPNWEKYNKEALALVEEIREKDYQNIDHQRQQVNTLSEKLNDEVYTQVSEILKQDKPVGLLGGDHSTPYGCIKAHLEKFPEMGILHFDAHHDLRDAYEGFTYSHASIMHNVLTKTDLKTLVSVGIRDYCEEEHAFAGKMASRVTTFYDRYLYELAFTGEHFRKTTWRIISSLPQQVYVSFDIDGLDPAFCPHTGTPVPGGLSFNKAIFILEQILVSGRRIVGFDLVEVAPNPMNPKDEWDLNVGARLLYKLCTLVRNSVHSIGPVTY